MLKINNISFSYGEKEILKNFSLELNAGECVCLVGPSGCGKTTLLRLILNLEKAQKGSILAPKKISCVFQEDRLLEWFNVSHNLTLSLEKAAHEKAFELLDEIGLGDAKTKAISELSGGMKRRVAIVKAVAFGGDLLLLDEAFNGIDADNKQIVAKMLKREFLDKKKSILMVSHVDEDIELLNAKKIQL